MELMSAWMTDLEISVEVRGAVGFGPVSLGSWSGELGVSVLDTFNIMLAMMRAAKFVDICFRVGLDTHLDRIFLGNVLEMDSTEAVLLRCVNSIYVYEFVKVIIVYLFWFFCGKVLGFVKCFFIHCIY